MLSLRAATILATSAFLLVACGGDPQASTDAPAPQNSLDATACSEVSDANLNLATATNAEQAQAAADVLDTYDPPADARDAIDHVVAAGGVKFDDADFDVINRVDAWVREVCPE